MPNTSDPGRPRVEKVVCAELSPEDVAQQLSSWLPMGARKNEHTAAFSHKILHNPADFATWYE